MIVVNKRYYDYDYDNNTIIMFDAEDVALTLDLDDDIDYCSIDNPQLDEKQQSAEQKTKKPIQSQSTDTVPDDNIIAPTTPPHDHNYAADEKSNKSQTPPADNIYGLSSSNKISWISSTSPKGSRRIPYALHIAHSYTISKLPVTLSTLVNTKTLRAKQEEKLRAKQAAAAAHSAHAQPQPYHYQQIHPHPHPHSAQYHYPHPQYVNRHGAHAQHAQHGHARPYHQYPYPYGRRKQENTLASPANHYGSESPRYAHKTQPQPQPPPPAQYVYPNNNNNNIQK